MKYKLGSMDSKSRCTLLLILFWLSGGLLWSHADWTVLVYMAADNGLSEYAIQDINDMESAEIPAATNVIVQADLNEISSPSGAFRYKITHDVTSEIESQVISNLGDIDSGDWQSLKSFINWGFSHYPAEHKAVIIWSHGDSWYKGSDYKWICPDNSSENIMSVAGGDLRNALTGIPALDVLLFDACSMQTMEVLSEVMDKTAYVVGSEDLVPATGFPYQDMLPIWQGEALNIVQQLPELYVNSYTPYGSQNPEAVTVKATCSVFNTQGLADFIFNLGYISGDSVTMMNDINLARANCYNLNTYDAEVDVMGFFTYIATHSTDEYLVSSANLILNDLSQLVVSSACINYDVDIGVAAIWFPTTENTFINWWDRYYKLSNMHAWLRLVYLSYGEAIVPVPKPEIVNAFMVYDRIDVTFKTMPYPDFTKLWRRFVSDMPNDSYGPTECDDAIFNDYFSGNYPNTMSVFNRYHNGWLYLFMKDDRGNVSEEDSVYVTYKDTPNKLLIYPNPVGNAQHLTFEWLGSVSERGKATDDEAIHFYNIKGRRLDIEPYGVYYGNTDHYVCTIDISKLPSGVYFAVAKTEGKTLKAKFTVIK
jgi:hypothetical protein